MYFRAAGEKPFRQSSAKSPPTEKRAARTAFHRQNKSYLLANQFASAAKTDREPFHTVPFALLSAERNRNHNKDTSARKTGREYKSPAWTHSASFRTTLVNGQKNASNSIESSHATIIVPAIIKYALASLLSMK